MELIELPGYSVRELIHDGPRTRVYRALRDADGRAVVVKVLKAASASHRELARFQLGLTIGQRIRSERVIEHLGLERCPDTLALVTEDYGATSLDRIETATLDLARRLALAVALAEALADVHAHHVIHKDVKPHNIVVHPQTFELKLIDFGISCQLSREHPALISPEGLEGTLSYISPEQTGRMNRAIDARSDLYSLGVTLYELFTGGLPFDATDPMALIHCQIARAPEPPSTRDARIPGPLSDLILRLMAKTAEARYQSAFGVACDLQRCLASVRAQGDVAPFELGARDVLDRFIVPDRLYGRDDEVAQLLEAFGRASRGGRELLLVAGDPGIGKSSLIHEVHRPIVARDGYFCAGKFDPFRRHLPYQALIDALRDLLRQVLSEPDARIGRVRDQLAAELGANARVIADVIPELARIVGPLPEVPTLGAGEAQNRFNRVFMQFLEVFATTEHPLTIFLDDLQWADLPSLQLMEVLITNPRSRHLLMVGAYRDNEVPETHPLLDAVRRIGDAGQPVRRIHLGSLQVGSVTQLVADATSAPAARADALGRLVTRKTGGNPFFVGEFLRGLYRDGHLTYDRQGGCWGWDIGALAELQTTDNVVALVTAKLNTLPEASRALLELAACVGSGFDLRTLARVTGLSLAEAGRRLGPALVEGLVLPLDAAYKYVEALDPIAELRSPAASDNPRFRFVHDRVHEAAHELLDESSRQQTHLRIGRMLEAECSETERDARLLDIANHMDLARALVTSPADRLAMARLHLDAGRRAGASMAYAPAAHYLRSALALLPESAWDSDHALALAIHASCAEALLMTEQYDALAALWQVVDARVDDPLDRVPLQRTRIRYRMALSDPHGALDLTIEVLRGLGIRVPRHPRKHHVLLGLLRARRAIAGRSTDALARLPQMTDARLLAAMDILRSNASSAYFTNADLFVLIVLEQVRLAALHGNSDLAANAYELYGMLLCGALWDVDTGYAFGELGFEILQQYPSAHLAGKMSLIGDTFIKPWKDPGIACARSLLAGWRSAVDGGDIEYAGYNILQSVILAVLGGLPLHELLTEYAGHIEWLRGTQQVQSIGFLDAWIQAVLHLTDSERVARRLEGEVFDLDDRRAAFEAAGDGMSLAYASVADGLLASLMGDPERAAESLQRATRHGDHLFASQMLPATQLFGALALGDLARRGQAPRRAARRALKRARRALRRWARFNPRTFGHKLRLLEAELAALDGRGTAARAAYRDAIEQARQAGMLHDEALASERCAQRWLAEGELGAARAYLRRARHCYQLWGALAKVRDLEATHPELSESSVRPSAITDGTEQSTRERRSHADLDLATVLKASQTISEVVGLEPLLARLTRIVIENAGADRGVLLLDHEGCLRIEADGRAGHTPEVLQGVALDALPEDDPPLAVGVVKYVMRTRELTVVDEPSTDSRFDIDPYIVRRAPRSVLCGPITHQADRLLGVLYLENSLVSGAFDPSRVELLRMLSSQMAIAIENARLYSGLELKVRERTRALAAATEQARSASRAKSAFLAGMSHELRTPLNGVLGHVQLLRQDATLGPGQQRSLQAVEDCGLHLLTLIDDVLDMAKIESGRVDVRAAPCNLHRVLHEAHSIVAGRAVAKGLELGIAIAPDVPEGLLTDGPKLRQVLINLLGNGVKFTESGRVDLTCTVAADGLRIEIADTGAGIAPEDAGRLFEPFSQGEAGRRHGGTGLGLPISQQLVEALGGRLEVTSDACGSAFTIVLPLEVVDAPDGMRGEDTLAVRRRLAAGQTLHAVVADEAPVNREILAMMLAAAGVSVTQAATGAEALERVRQPEVRLILLDLRIPAVGGLEVVRRIRAAPELATVAVIAVSASATAEQRQEALDAGCDAFLAKPLRGSELFEATAQVSGVTFVVEPAARPPVAASDRPQALTSPRARELARDLLAAARLGDLGRLERVAVQAADDPVVPAALSARITTLVDRLELPELIRLAGELAGTDPGGSSSVDSPSASA